MDFIAAVNNVTGEKMIPDREEVEGLAWGVKRFLAMHPALIQTVRFLDQFYFVAGSERFYELLVYCMPRGRYRMKSVKKAELPPLDMSDDLRRKVCRYFKIKPSEIPVLLEVVSLEDVKRAFGVNEKLRRVKAKKARTRAKRKRK